ncbi:MAG: DUF4012 domain-containing protein [Candidatus Curtissbacteria bacterium]|nr:DUF4012 domain-containing protein [Candidatus Curtissbacteria bacterium]
MSAPTNLSVLITEAGTFLGAELAKAYLAQNATVYGVSHSALPHELLSHHNFTLLELDLSQPLPPYLPDFDLIFDLSILKHSKISLFSQMPTVPHQTENIISHLKEETKLIVFSKITTSEDLYDYLTRSEPSLKRKLRLILVGDLYGPGMPERETDELTSLIFQAIKADKIILEDEGLRHIYPSYIDDVIKATIDIASEQLHNQIYRLVSERAKTSLTVAYEIQDVARLALNKELGLFFSGPQKQINHEAEIIITHEIQPRTSTRDGLKLTLASLAKNYDVENSKKTEVTKPLHHPILPYVSEKKKSPNMLEKFPKFNSDLNFRPKNIIIIVLVLLTLILAKTGLDLYLGATNLKVAKSKALVGDFKKAREKAMGAQKSFHAASNKTKLIKSLNTQISALETGSTAAIYFIDGSEAISKNFYSITRPEMPANQDKDNASANFHKASTLSAYAASQLTHPKIEAAKQELTELSHLSQSAYELSNLMEEATGTAGKKTYLILLQNNTELRPGGGFIGNYATVEFKDGKLGEIAVDDIYNIDGQLKEKIEPPKELKEKLGTTQLYLRDSNWSPDNTLNAQTERELFKKETDRDVDGIITIDLTFMQEVLQATGSIRLEDYKEDINAQNLFEKGEYYSEIGFSPGSTQKKDFFGALTRALIAKVIQPEKQTDTANPQIAIIKAVKDALRAKHIMLTFDNPNLSTYVSTNGWNQPMPPLSFNPADDSIETRDFLAISEANIGANKVNRFIDRKISYEMTVGRDADLIAKLIITYNNKSQAETWPGGKYTNFLRVYIPFASGLEDYTLSLPPETKPTPSPKPRTNTPIPPEEDNVINKNDVQVINQGNLTVFQTMVEVPIKSTQIVTFTYRIPKNIKLETNPTYHVYFSKQPGTEADPLTFTFNLPQYLKIKSINASEELNGKQNVKTETDLGQDRQFAIEIKKN